MSKNALIIEFRKKFGHYRGQRPDGSNQLEIEEFVGKVFDEGRKGAIEDVKMLNKDALNDSEKEHGKAIIYALKGGE